MSFAEYAVTKVMCGGEGSYLKPTKSLEIQGAWLGQRKRDIEREGWRERERERRKRERDR